MTMGPDAGYYSYDPTLYLEKPIAIAGPLGAGTGIVGAYLTQRTGLPFIELDRWVEHQSSQSMLELHISKGSAYVHRLERRLLKRALSETPRAVVSLGEGALSSAYARFYASQRSTLIYLKHEREVLNDQVENMSANDRAVFLGAAPNEESYTRYLNKRENDFKACAHVIEVGARSAVHVAHEIIEREENKWR